MQKQAMPILSIRNECPVRNVEGQVLAPTIFFLPMGMRTAVVSRPYGKPLVSPWGSDGLYSIIIIWSFVLWSIEKGLNLDSLKRRISRTLDTWVACYSRFSKDTTISDRFIPCY